jgi:phosphatidylserine/phosphatidylglycerophosphate/cardiolipin synthase-like enzyme
VLRDIGDWRLKAGRLNLAAKSYRKAWRALDTADDGTREQQELFEQPEIVRGGSLGAGNLNRLFVSDSDIPDAASGAVEVEVLVDATGSARNVRIISANPYWASQSAVSMIASARFRPRFEDREFVPARVRYTWEFHYDPVVAERLGLLTDTSD